MATVRLSDAVIPEVYGTYTAVDSPEKSEIISSGIAVRTALFDGIARAGGKTGTIPFWLDLDASVEENQSNDDPADFAIPQKLGSRTMIYRKSFINQSYSDMDLVVELAGSDPMQRIRNRFGKYWQLRDQKRLVATLRGIYADNVANDAGDMVVNIGGLTADAANWNADSAIDAEFTMGDAAGSFVAIIVHSQIAAKMKKLDMIETIKDSQGKSVDVYMGKRVIVDDGVPKTGSGADTIYTSIFFGAGAVGFGGVEGHAFAIGEGIPKVPVWVQREEQAGNGGGMEQVGERRTIIMHPFGFKWIEDPASTENDLVEFSPTNADLANAAHWDRVVDRKQVPIAFLLSKANKPAA
jgi:hypothetical protein